MLFRYFPNFANNRVPQRSYLLNVVNTLKPNSIIELVQNLQKAREENKFEYEPIPVINEYAELLDKFESIHPD